MKAKASGLELKYCTKMKNKNKHTHTQQQQQQHKQTNKQTKTKQKKTLHTCHIRPKQNSSFFSRP